MLLEAEEGSLCSLEVLDDVAEQTGDGKAKLIQSKWWSGTWWSGTLLKTFKICITSLGYLDKRTRKD